MPVRCKKKGTSECDTIVEQPGRSFRTRWPWNRRRTVNGTFKNHDEKREVAVCLHTSSLVPAQMKTELKLKAGIEWPILTPMSFAPSLDFRRVVKKVLTHSRPALFKLGPANGTKSASKRSGLPISVDNNTRTHVTVMSERVGPDNQVYTQYHEERPLYASDDFTYNIKSTHLRSVIRTCRGCINDNVPRQSVLAFVNEKQPSRPVAGDKASNRDKKKGSAMAGRVLMTHQNLRPGRCRKVVSFCDLKHNRKYILNFGNRMMSAVFLSSILRKYNFKLPSGEVQTISKEELSCIYSA